MQLGIDFFPIEIPLPLNTATFDAVSVVDGLERSLHVAHTATVTHQDGVAANASEDALDLLRVNLSHDRGAISI
jgi:hypothetical protein